jgi:hypothetical protein
VEQNRKQRINERYTTFREKPEIDAYYMLLDFVRDLSYEYDFSDAEIQVLSGRFTKLYNELKTLREVDE